MISGKHLQETLWFFHVFPLFFYSFSILCHVFPMFFHLFFHVWLLIPALRGLAVVAGRHSHRLRQVAGTATGAAAAAHGGGTGAISWGHGDLQMI